jgi:phosphoenolpyruvate carboxykinase (ATP)
MNNHLIEKVKTELKKYGVINPTEIFYNLSYDELFEHETNLSLTGFDRGFVTNTDSIVVL